MRDIIKRGVFGAAAGLMGVFLLVRLQAFLVVGYDRALSRAALGAGVGLLAALGAVCAGPVERFFRRWSLLYSVTGGVLCGLSLGAVWPLRGILVGRALEGSGVGMRPGVQVLYLLGAGALLGLFLCCAAGAVRDGLPGLRRFMRTVDRRDVLYLLGLLAALNLLVRLYAVHSSTIYYWDNAGYWTTARSLADQWRRDGLLSVLRSAYDSVLTNDYNYLIALPAMAMARLFGESRYVFLAAIVNFGYYPLAVLLWALAKSTSRRPRLTAAGLLLLLPLALSAVLDGFVDVGGVCFTLTAMLLWRLDRGRNDFGRFLLAGLCLAAAILLRRWYAFFGASFVLALGLDCLLFRRSAAPLLGTLAGAAFGLLFLFQPLVSGRLLADYGSLYVAYDLGLDRDLLLLCYRFGLLPLGLGLGLGLWMVTKKETREAGVFLLSQLVLCFLLFVRVQTHGQQHLLLYVPALALLFLQGLLALERLPARRAVALTLVLTMLPSLSPFLPRQRPAGLQDLNYPSPLPAFLWYPRQWEGADQVVALIRRLDRLGEAGETVGVLASSFQLNRDILVNAEASLSLPRVSEADRDSYLLSLPQVDQRDGWWDTLFRCDVLVVADPVQLHLGAENQAVVALPVEELLTGAGFAAAYERLDETWPLAEGITVSLYRRTREVTEDEREALRQRFFALHPDAKYNGAAR